MAQGLTITDEQRGALPPEILSVVDEYDQMYVCSSDLRSSDLLSV
jgi:hypothetical protein